MTKAGGCYGQIKTPFLFAKRGEENFCINYVKKGGKMFFIPLGSCQEIPLSLKKTLGVASVSILD